MAYGGCFGCFFFRSPDQYGYQSRHYLPQVDLTAHTAIQSTASRTTLVQTFLNNTSDKTPEIQYTFPLYDGVSVVAFKCTIGEKVIFGVVKEKNQARTEYQEAVSRGEAAGLLEQSYDASDVFSTKVGNIPKDGKAIVEIEYVGELKHDSQLDGVRFTIPTAIAPRYGTLSSDPAFAFNSANGGKIEIVVDVEVDDGAHIEGVSSPSHPIAMTLGRTTTQKDTFKSNRASATLSLGSAELGKDFVVVVNAQDHAIPRALLEEHPDIPKHRALMTTLVPKFNLPNIHPEIVFIVDRSGSMAGKIPILVEALKVFLKSLPLSAKFNICSFGSNFTFLFKKSQPYDERSLEKALKDVGSFAANYGGTELLTPIRETVKNRLQGVPLEIMVLTDGEIWDQQAAFDFVNEAARSDVRLFSLGIGTGASTSLVEGLARAGNGFAQFIQDNEKIDRGVVRMLKAALGPHITDYRLEISYEVSKDSGSSDDDFEMVESATGDEKSISGITLTDSTLRAPISLFSPNFKETATNPAAGRYDHLPAVVPPKELQAPNHITGLFPYSRTCAYVLLPNSTRPIRSVMLQGTYGNSPVQLEIPVQGIGKGKTIHQLAAKKAMLEIEEGRGWLSTAKSGSGRLLQTEHLGDWERIVEREAVRIGVEFQVAGKFCSFVAVEKTSDEKHKVLHSSEEQQSSQAGASQAPIGFLDCSSPSYNKKSKRLSSSGGPSMNAFSPPGPFSARILASQAPAGSATMKSAGFGGFGFGSPAPPPPPAASVFGNAGSERMGVSPSFQSRSSMFGSASSSAKEHKTSPPPATSLFGGAAFGQAQQLQMQQGAAQAQTTSGPSAYSGMSLPAAADRQRRSRGTSTPFSFGGLAKKKMAPNFGGLFGRGTSADAGGSVEDEAESEAEQATVPNGVEAKMHKIIGLQRFDGSWAAEDQLLTLTDIWKGDFKDASLQYDDEKVKATVLAIAWLEKVAASEIEVWEMVADKAKEWLRMKQGIVDVDVIVRRAIAIFFP